MTLDAHLELRVVLQRHGDFLQHGEGLRLDLGLVEGEEDLLLQLDLVFLDDDALVEVGAAVVVLVAVEVLRLVGALVLHVRDTVRVIVRVGAAVFVLELVEVLRLVGALVGLVGNAVQVVVHVRAAVRVFEPVLVFRVVGALVFVVGDTVAVLVPLGAAVVVLVAVVVLRLLGAAILGVQDAIVVVISFAPLADGAVGIMALLVRYLVPLYSILQVRFCLEGVTVIRLGAGEVGVRHRLGVGLGSADVARLLHLLHLLEQVVAGGVNVTPGDAPSGEGQNTHHNRDVNGQTRLTLHVVPQ